MDVGSLCASSMNLATERVQQRDRMVADYNQREQNKSDRASAR